MLKHLLICSLAFAEAASFGQAFRNLNFEQANVSHASSSGWVKNVPVAEGLPGWTVSPFWTAPPTIVFYNDVWLDSPAVGIYDGGLGNHVQLPTPIAGKYSAFLMSDGPNNGYPNNGDSFIAQTGQVPSSARSLWFVTSAQSFWAQSNPQAEWELSVYLGGQRLGIQQRSVTANTISWAADVTGLAGTVAEMRFNLHSQSAAGSPPHDLGVIVGLDSIQFSPTVVPEPGSVCLLGLAASLLVAGRTQFRGGFSRGCCSQF